MWDVHVTIVPVIIGWLGPIKPNLKSYIRKIGIKPSVSSHQKSALFGTINILWMEFEVVRFDGEYPQCKISDLKGKTFRKRRNNQLKYPKIEVIKFSKQDILFVYLISCHTFLVIHNGSEGKISESSSNTSRDRYIYLRAYLRNMGCIVRIPSGKSLLFAKNLIQFSFTKINVN